MKKKKIALLLTMLLIFGIGLGTKALSEQVQVILARDIKVSLDGEIQTLKAETQEQLYPIIYEGYSYLPLKSISELAGLNVNWDENSRTVLLEKDIEPWKAGAGINVMLNKIGRLKYENRQLQDENDKLLKENENLRSNNINKKFEDYITDGSDLSKVIVFNDENLEKAIREKTNKPIGDVYLSDVIAITELNLEATSIRNIDSLANLKNLEMLNLAKNRITDIKPLANLKNLKTLNLAENNITDISWLANITDLNTLDLRANSITDIRPLANLKNLETLNLAENNITDFSPLENLPHIVDVLIHLLLFVSAPAFAGIILFSIMNKQTI